METYGFIGTGNMGGAIARAVCRRISPDQVFLSNRTPEKAQILAAELGCRVADNAAVAKSADFILLGVKPQMTRETLDSIAPLLDIRETRFVLVSMVAGMSIAELQAQLGGPTPVIRIMPNTPVSVGKGMILYALSPEVSSAEEAAFCRALSDAGRLAPVAERLIDAGSAVSGCGPAFADLFLEGLADGGVACGLPRAQAMEFAAQMLAGTAELYLQSGSHPGVLKDAVCSPGGSTIQGVRTLEACGFRSACMEAVIAAYEKTLDLGKH